MVGRPHPRWSKRPLTQISKLPSATSVSAASGAAESPPAEEQSENGFESEVLPHAAKNDLDSSKKLMRAFWILYRRQKWIRKPGNFPSRILKMFLPSLRSLCPLFRLPCGHHRDRKIDFIGSCVRPPGGRFWGQRFCARPILQ